MSTEDVAKIEYIEAITADNTGANAAVLEYPDLSDTVREYARETNRRQNLFWDAEPGSLEEIRKGRQLGFEFFVATADKVVGSTPETRDLWADRYTNSCIELFGAPGRAEVINLISKQSSQLQPMRDNPKVDQTKLELVLESYEELTEDNAILANETDRSNEANQQLAISEMRRVLEERYSDVLGLVEQSGRTVFEQADLVELFTTALKKLAEVDDRAWSEWKVDCPKKGTAISVNGRKQLIVIPEKRGPAKAREVTKLLGHELLIHGLRAKNGKKASNELMFKGFPSYLDGEEGLGIIGGAAVGGNISDNVYDRYIDIALAVGIVGRAPKKRHELAELVQARKVVRAQADGEAASVADIQKEASAYVDRIYRGGPADDIGTRQAVYTADIYYYKGFRDVCNFIAEKLAGGHGIDKVFDYLMQGKFDPNNPLHVAEIGELA